MPSKNEQERRAELIAEDKCILGGSGKRFSRVVHGKPVRGGKCQRCLDVHKATDTTAKRMDRAYRQRNDEEIASMR